MSIVLKIVMAAVVLIAAASGTEVVDVVEVMGDVTQQAQSMAGDVDVESDETGLFDERVDDDDAEPDTGESNDVQVFARSSDKTGVRSASEAMAFAQPASKSITSFTKTIPSAVESNTTEPTVDQPVVAATNPSSSSNTPAATATPATTATPGTSSTPTINTPTTAAANSSTTTTTPSTTAGPTTTAAPTTTTAAPTTTTAAPTTTTAAPTTTTAAPTTTTAAPTTTTAAPTTTTAAPTTTTTVAG